MATRFHRSEPAWFERGRRTAAAGLLGFGLGLAAAASAAAPAPAGLDPHAGHAAHAGHAKPGGADHAGHVTTTTRAPRSTADYTLPRVKLTRHDGRTVEFAADIDDGRPLLVNFIFTTCTAICPVMTQIFAEVQARLGADAAKVRMVSVSIDPEQDTPRRLAEYARTYSAGPQWSFYTGSVEASVAVQKGFAAYRGDKMNHTPLTLMRGAPGQPWLRIDGFATPDELLNELRQLRDGR